jgi:RNA polymerase sigma factor (sigma-70 family)
MEAHAVPAPRVSPRRSPVRHSLLSDERLARLVSTGDEQAFATLYQRYHQQLYRYCRSMLRHDADAQDALQSAMTSAYAALRRSQRDAPVRPWLFRIAHNESISVMRRRRPTTELTDDLGATVASVEDHEQQRAELTVLLADLKELPERQRSALVMRELSGLSHEDIALALDTSLGGAKQAIFEARRALSEFVEGREMSCDEVCRLVSDADGRVLRGRRVRAHLRDCSSCTAFAATIRTRSADLRALAPPLPALAAAGVLTRVIGTSSAGGGIGMGGGAGVAGTLGGKTATLGLLAKAATAVVVVSGATVGITGVVEHAPTPVHHHPAFPAAGTAGHASTSGTSSHSVGRAISGSVTLTTPAATHPTGRSTHAAAFHSQGNSGTAPSAAVGRGVVTPPGRTMSSTVTPPGQAGGNSGATPGNSGSGSSGSTHGSSGTTQGSATAPGSTVSSTKSTRGQAESTTNSTTPTVPTPTPQTAHATTTTPLGRTVGKLAKLIG